MYINILQRGHIVYTDVKEVIDGIAGAVADITSYAPIKLADLIVLLATKDEYIKNTVIQFVATRFKEDVRKALGISFAGIKLHWDEGFENFLKERKKRRKVRSQETLQYYKSIFLKYLEGKELSEQLIDYVVNHENKWLRNVFRHHIQYLYHKRLISPETFGWIMEVVSSRGYKLDVRPY